MAISGTPTGPGPDVVVVEPGGDHRVNGEEGDDLLRVLYETLATDVDWEAAGFGWQRLTDGFRSSVEYVNFERYDIRTGRGDDVIHGGEEADRLSTGAGADGIVTSLGADTVDGGRGHDWAELDYRSLNDDVDVALHQRRAVTIDATGASLKGIEALRIDTGAGADVIDTRRVSGDDRVTTRNGDDTFATRSGRDTYNAGDGRDTLIVDYGAETANVRHVSEGFGWTRIEAGPSGPAVSYAGVEAFDLTGGAGHDRLEGRADDDRLVGNGGDDTLVGGGGEDIVDGGAGTDLWVANFAGESTRVVVDLVRGRVAGATRIDGIERIDFTGCVANDRVVARPGAFDDTFVTGDGDDQVTTGRGRDEANGGSGEDLLAMDWSAVDDPLAGIVHRYEGFGWASFSARSGDRLDYAGFERFDLSGGAGADHLVGGDAGDTLSGGAGEDTLESRGGGGVIEGGAGDDLWIARLGDVDTPVEFDARQSQNRPQGRKSDLSVREVEAVDIETGAGRDKISTRGYALHDVIKTGAGNDRVDPGLGRNEVNGGEGTDTLVVDMSPMDRAVTVVPIGFGWYRIADEGGASSTEFTGMERFVFTGGTGDDALIGGADNDRLVGGAGNDTLEGVSGRDVIDGKAGEDTWIADHGSEAGGLGLSLNAAGSGRLGGVGTRLKRIENVDLATGEGDDRIDLSRGTGDDRIRTAEGDDAVDVGRGRRELADGGDGEDVLAASAALAEAGVRTVSAGFGWWTMEARDGSYDLDYRGFERLSLAGSAHNDRLFGFDESDTLSGGEGRDILDGGEGDDVLTGGAESDLFRFSRPGDAGIDTITDAGGGDILRLPGVEMVGPVRAGGAGTLLEGEVAADVRADRTMIGVGLDDTPGADFAVVLLGSYALADFQVDGGDLLVG